MNNFFSVSDIKDAPENFTGDVNIEEFWDSVQLEMISRGFVQSMYIFILPSLNDAMHLSILIMSRVLFTGCAKNSFSVRPSFEYWGPWIGKNTRRSEMALNTEFEKASSAKSSTEAEVSMVSEDRLADELMKQKVQLLCMHVYLFELHCAVTSYFISCLYFKRFQLCINCARPVIWMRRDRGWI